MDLDLIICNLLLINLITGENNISKNFPSPKVYKESNMTQQITTNFTRLMVIGGRNESGFLSDVELVDPFNANSKCKKPPQFPQQRYYMVSNFVNGAPTVCGGYSNNTFANVTMEEVCFRLMNKSNTWEFKNSPSLHYPRVYAAGAVVNGSWWITGGYHWYYPSFISSDILRPNVTSFISAANLPERMMDHCMATINSSHVFLAGGSYGSGHQGKLHGVNL